MTRTWIGAGLLAVVLAGGWVMGFYAQRYLPPAARELRQAEEAVLAGDWETAAQRTGQAEQAWRKAAPLCHQDTMDRIDAAFVQLAAAQRSREPGCAVQCAMLAHDLEALAETFGCHWQQFW